MSEELYKKFMVPCVMMDRVTVPDGLGGFQYGWKDGAPFMAAIVKNTTLAARVAEKQGVKEVYTVTTPITVRLKNEDVIKRSKDGATFRCTSNSVDSETPSMATFKFAQVNAERWDPPK